MASEKKEDDPFTRRKCQPTLVTLVRIIILLLCSQDSGIVYLTVTNTLCCCCFQAFRGASELLQQLSQSQDDKETAPDDVVR